MTAPTCPTCPNCGAPITRVLDLPYGWWEWDGSKYALATAARRVDTAPWVHADCMGELRHFHPQDPVPAGQGVAAAAERIP